MSATVVSTALVSDPFAIIVVLVLTVVLADGLGRLGWLKKVGSALLVIFFGMVLVNLKIIPPAGGGGPAYDPIFAIAVPGAIFLVLLNVNLAALKRAGGLVIGAFLLGAMGVCAGVITATWLVPVRGLLGADAGPVAGMFTGTYIGGSANFNAVALAYDIVRDGPVYTAAVVVDNVMTDVWIVLLLALPTLLRRLARFGPRAAPETHSMAPVEADDAALPGTLALSVPLALAAAALIASNWLSALLETQGIPVPAVLIITTMALIVAQVPVSRRITMAQPIGMWTLLLFLAAVGASADIAALVASRDLGAMLFGFVAVIFAVHGLVVIAGGWLLRIDPVILAMASSANIGGSTTAIVIAEAENRPDLALPGILIGSLGTALGTYAGFGMVAFIG